MMYVDASQYYAGFEDGVADERAKVVAHLRKLAEFCPPFLDAASRIERGEHAKETP